MFKKNYDLAIVDRSFWPESEILGEGKLFLAEHVAKKGQACVIAQSSTNVAEATERQKRGQGVKFYITKSHSSSESSIILRIFDAMMFGIYVYVPRFPIFYNKCSLFLSQFVLDIH
jgi:hypothetical protein